MSGSNTPPVTPVPLDGLTPMSSFPDGSHIVVSQPSPVDPTKRVFGTVTLDAAGIPTGTGLQLGAIPDANAVNANDLMPIYQDGVWKQTTIGAVLAYGQTGSNPVVTIPGESVSGTTITAPGSVITDAGGATFGLTQTASSGFQPTKNGVQDTRLSNVELLLYQDQIVYAKNTSGQWFAYSGLAWAPVSSGDPRAAAPPQLYESASGTTITAPGTALIDANLIQWSLFQPAGGGMQSARNGVVDTSLSNISLLLLYNHVIYAKVTSGAWYTWTGSAYVVRSAGDPRVTAPPVVDPTQPVNGVAPTNTIFGANLDGFTGTVQPYETWLGKQLPLSSIFTGNASQDDYINSIAYAIGIRGGDAGRQCISLPNFWYGANWDSASTGGYDALYFDAASRVLTEVAKHETEAGLPHTSIIYLRIAWEHNAAGQFVWASNGVEAKFILAWRRAVTQFRAADTTNRFRYVFCPTIGNDNPELSWPGDAYVDLVGLDFYHGPEFGEPTDPIFAWDYMRNRQYGLDWLVGFGALHNKPLCFPEWGLKTNNMGPYIKRFYQYCIDHSVRYACYWETNGAYPGKLSDGTNPNTGLAYRHYVNPSVFPTEPAVPLLNLVADAAGDLTNGWWGQYSDTGSVTRGTNTVSFVGGGGNNQSISFQLRGQPPGTLGLPPENYIFCVTVTRLSGSGPLELWTYGTSNIHQSYTLAQTPVNVATRLTLAFSFTNHVDNVDIQFHNTTGTDNSYRLTNIGMYIDRTTDPFP